MMADACQATAIPVIGLAGFSGSGKTTLLKKLIPLLLKNGIRAAVIKHAHHRFDIDTPGKDSYEVRQAGAQQVLVASRHRWALMVETPEQGDEPSLPVMLKKIDTTCVDIVLVEGFRRGEHEKIEVFRAGLKHEMLHPDDKNIIAIASDVDSPLDSDLPQLNLNKPEQICDFILKHVEE